MDRKSFGCLLAALRQELGLTQIQLAELVDEDADVISNVERGTKKIIGPELLYRLANVLHLTTLERREFFLAASGLEAKDIVRQPGAVIETEVFNEQQILDKAVSVVGQLRIPAFLVDVFSDVIAANRCIIELMQISPESIAQAPNLPGGYSTLRLAYGDAMRSTISDGYEDFAVTTMRAFREVSLRYRAHPYFRYLMKEFRNPKNYPWFERTWRKVSAMDHDKDANIDPFFYSHTVYGQLSYYSSSSVLYTSYGELFLIQYLPVDEHTADVFEQITRQVGAETLRFAPWPEKKIS